MGWYSHSREKWGIILEQINLETFDSWRVCAYKPTSTAAKMIVGRRAVFLSECGLLGDGTTEIDLLTVHAVYTVGNLFSLFLCLLFFFFFFFFCSTLVAFQSFVTQTICVSFPRNTPVTRKLRKALIRLSILPKMARKVPEPMKRVSGTRSLDPQLRVWPRFLGRN